MALNSTSAKRQLAWGASVLYLAALEAVAWADVAPAPLIKRLDGATRAKVLAALAGLVILGFGMVALVWLGARFTHRYRHGSAVFRPTQRPGEHDWARKPLDEGKES
jgi:hypothetical protein